MAVTLIAQPGEIVFSKNPVVFQLRAAATVGGPTYAAKGVGAYFQAPLTGRFPSGSTVTLDYTEEDGTMESVTVTAGTGDDQLPDASFTGTDSEYWAFFAAQLQGHPRVGPFFTATPVAAGSDIRLTVREKSALAGWAVTLANSAGFAVTPLAATGDSTPANYRVLLEVFFEKTYRGGDYISAALLEGLPDADTGFLFFDLQSILEAQCRAYRSEPLVPVWATNAPQIADNLRRFYVRYTEEAGNPVTTQEWQYTAIKLALDGGISQSLLAEIPDYLEQLDDTNNILSWLPSGKQVVKNAPEYISWFNSTGSDAEVRLNRQKYTDVDGLPFENQTWYYVSPITARPYETVIFPLRPLLQSGDFDGAYKSVLRVLDAADNEISPAITLYHDKNYYESKRHIQYLNSFGVPENWTCRGQLDKSIQIDRSVAQRPLAPGYDTYATDTYNYFSEAEYRYLYRTGWLRKSEAETLVEMLQAQGVYDVSEDGYIPLRLATNDFKVTATRENLHAYEFAAIPRLKMRNFSKRQVNAQDVNAWQDETGAFYFDENLQPWEI